MKKSGLLRRIAVIITAFLMLIFPTNTVFALSSSNLDRFAENNILFYDPGASERRCGDSTIAIGENRNYAGATIFTDGQLAAIQSNMPFYQAAAQKYGFPWQIIAVIHGQEHAFLRDNPANGQGAYQLYTYTGGGTNANAFLPAGPIDDAEFQRQTDIAASVIVGKAAGLDLNTADGVKSLFFGYNGRAHVYIDQAIALGFSQEEASHGEGSPYVMNRYDAQRDPTVEPTKSNGTWGQIKTDGGNISYPANSGFGTYVKFVALGGSVSGGGSGDDCPLPGGNMDLNATAISLAWPLEQRSQSRTSPTLAYKEAIAATWINSAAERNYVSAGRFNRNGSGVWIPVGKSCDNFVGTAVRYSGIDQNFPIWLGSQKTYLRDSPNWELVTVNSVADARAGDIRIENGDGHIVMIVEVNGKMGIASASSGDRFGDINNYYSASGSKVYRLRSNNSE